MKALMTLLVVVSGFAAHAAINTRSNSDCSERAKGSLFSLGNTNPPPEKQEVKPQDSAPVQHAGIKAKTQGT